MQCTLVHAPTASGCKVLTMQTHIEGKIFTTRIAKLVRWVQLQVTTLPLMSAVSHPSVVHSVQLEGTHLNAWWVRLHDVTGNNSQ